MRGCRRGRRGVGRGPGRPPQPTPTYPNIPQQAQRRHPPALRPGLRRLPSSWKPSAPPSPSPRLFPRPLNRTRIRTRASAHRRLLRCLRCRRGRWCCSVHRVSSPSSSALPLPSSSTTHSRPGSSPFASSGPQKSTPPPASMGPSPVQARPARALSAAFRPPILSALKRRGGAAAVVQGVPGPHGSQGRSPVVKRAALRFAAAGGYVAPLGRGPHNL